MTQRPAGTGEALFGPEFLARLERIRLVLKSRTLGRQAGDRRSRRKGLSLEFADYRPYSPGDDIRHLDWNIYSRLDRPFIRTFYEEEDVLVRLVVDASASMAVAGSGRPGDASRRPTKFDQARRIAGGLAWVALAGLDRVAVTLFDASERAGGDVLRGKGAIFRLLDRLERLEAGGRTRIDGVLRRIALGSPGRGIVFVVSDFLDPAGCRDGLEALRSRGLEVRVIRVIDPTEIEPALSGDLCLVDSETGDRLEASLSPALLRRYREMARAFGASLRRDCLGNGIDYLEVVTSTPAQTVLLTAMAREGMVS